MGTLVRSSSLLSTWDCLMMQNHVMMDHVITLNLSTTISLLLSLDSSLASIFSSVLSPSETSSQNKLNHRGMLKEDMDASSDWLNLQTIGALLSKLFCIKINILV